jgi:hypothetical protein
MSNRISTLHLKAKQNKIGGKGYRNKRTGQRFTVDESQDSSSDASTVRMYGPTQFDTPSIPPGLTENAVRTTRQVVNVPTQFFQQNAEYSQSYCVDSVLAVMPSISDNTRSTVERPNAKSLKAINRLHCLMLTLHRQLLMVHRL